MSDMTGTESPSETGQRPGWLVRCETADARLPIMDAWKKHLSEYYAPKNFNFWYYFGVLSMLVLAMQLLTGIWLTMNYTPSAEAASRQLNTSCGTWILAGSALSAFNGRSAFFFVVSAHVPRAHVRLYKNPGN